MTRCRLNAIFILVFVMTVFCGISYAKEDVKMEKFIIDEKEKSVPVVDVELEGVKINTDVPPIILNDRTLLPVRAVAENIGCNVKWNPDTYEVTIEKEYKVIKLKIDSATVYVNGQKKTLPDGVPAKIVTYKEAGRTMVPARFILEELGADVAWDASRRTVMLKKPQSHFDKDKESYITLNDIKWENGNVKIKTSGKPDFKDYVVSGPERLVVDLKNTKFELQQGTIEVKSSNVSKIRASQFETEPMVSRVVFDLQEYCNYDISSTEDGILISFVNEGSKEENEEPSEDEDDEEEGPHKNPVEIDIKTKDGAQIFEISTKGDINSKAIFLDSPERIAIDIMGAKLEDEQYNQKEVRNSYVKEIRSYYYKDEDRTRVVFTLSTGNFTSDMAVLKGTKTITLMKTKYIPEKKKNPVIVIDAGHGGKDPGAVGTDTKVTEKSIVLDMVQRLKPMLEEEGYIVKLTRDSDVFVDLYKRTAIANQAGADVFVSIHVNAAENRNSSGIETLYYPEAKRENREIDVRGLTQSQIESIIKQKQSQNIRNNKELAQIIQESLIDETRAVDRGIVERPGLVVIRETAMPAVLVELGFASNANEEMLLQTEEYKEKLAQALLKGIEDYFDR